MNTRTLRGFTLPALLATTAIFSACGSSQSGSSSTSGASTHTSTSSNVSGDATRSHFTACLESHGIKVKYSSDGTIEPQAGSSQQLANALHDCTHKTGATLALPGASTGSSTSTGSQSESIKKLDECLKSHGVVLGSATADHAKIVEAAHACAALLAPITKGLSTAQVKVGKITIGKIQLGRIKFGHVTIGKLHLKPVHIEKFEALERLGAGTSAPPPAGN